ncbi:MAG: hypothetical protein NVS9B15_13880 [Acidobacteriaceae bacterium]
MAMPLLDAPAYNPGRERMRRNLLIAGLVLIVLLAIGFWKFRYWPEEHAVNNFLSAVEHKDYEQAYADWNHDAAWKQHPEKYKNYGFGQFQLDWGPSGDYGTIAHHEIVGSAPSEGGRAVIVGVRINDRAELVPLIVSKQTKEIGFSPVGLRINTF